MKLRIDSKCCVSAETLERNTKLTEGWPAPRGSGHLLVVGGGPSIKRHVRFLREWTGDIWAINGTWHWCNTHGIDAIFYSVDPDPILKEYMNGVERAILAPHCEPSCFRPGFFRLPGELLGPTSATASAQAALEAGYTKVTYFGCESSFDEHTPGWFLSHAYDAPKETTHLRISCGGREFLTNLELILQAQFLSKLIKEAPTVYAEQSGGLLSAMIEHGQDFDALAGSKKLHDAMVSV